MTTVATESVDQKAGRLLASGAVTVLVCDDSFTIAHVCGDHGVHEVNWRYGAWSCTCPAFGDCSHRRAVRLVTVVTPQRPRA
jgi:uncharacterized Zn finger protein